VGETLLIRAAVVAHLQRIWVGPRRRTARKLEASE